MKHDFIDQVPVIEDLPWILTGHPDENAANQKVKVAGH